MAKTTIIDFYKIGNLEHEIILKIKIQTNQMARSTVRIENNPVGAGKFDDSFEVKLGKAKDILGYTLYVDTTEADINPDHNLVSFTIELAGGSFEFKKTIAQSIAPGTSVLYNAEITFV